MNHLIVIHLQNPDKNRYKIGIPDIGLDKVYGETSKSGSGGGGGGKSSDQTDEETNTDVDTIKDAEDEAQRVLDEKGWAHVITNLNSDDQSLEDVLNGLLTPGERDPASNYNFGLAADALKTTVAQIREATIEKVKTKIIEATGAIDTDSFSANTSNTGRTNATSVDVVENVSAAVMSAKDKVTSKIGEFTDNIKVDGKTIKFGLKNNTPTITINGTEYRLTTE